MTAYEFTRFDADKTHLLKGKSYDFNVLALDIEKSRKNIRESAEYKDAEDTFIELTMSCCLDEARHWVKVWMMNALAYDIFRHEPNAKAYLLAAYDLYQSLV